MKINLNEITLTNKALLLFRIIASIGVVLLSVLQLLGVWKDAINLTIPLMGMVLLIQSIQEWKQRRGVAIFGLCAALFIFACAAIVWFIR